MTGPNPQQDAARPPWWIFNWGLGVDSTALLLRLFQILEPLARDQIHGAARDAVIADRLGLPGFAVDRLCVVVAMVGSEWPLTGELATAYVLPLLRRYRIRLLQVARAGPTQNAGVTVLDDSRAPTTLHLSGDFTLFTEMVQAGTIPQLGGARKCSLKAKGWPLDQVIGRITGGEPYIQILGFEAEEASRCIKDTAANTAVRTGVYPLRNWGWTRAVCEYFIHGRLGVWWPKSACTYCPYALASRAGRTRVLAGFATAPQLAWEPLVMEWIAQAINPRQTLIAGSSLYDLMACTAGQEEALIRFHERLDDCAWALVRARRAMDSRKNDPTVRGAVARSLTVEARGERADMQAALAGTVAQLGELDVTDPRHPRVWVRRRAAVYPTTEELWTIVPALVADKTAMPFPKMWDRCTRHTRAYDGRPGSAEHQTLHR